MLIRKQLTTYCNNNNNLYFFIML